MKIKFIYIEELNCVIVDEQQSWKNNCWINCRTKNDTYINMFIFVRGKVECPSDKRKNFCRKYSQFVSVKSQILRHVARRDALLDLILCWKATDISIQI